MGERVFRLSFLGAAGAGKSALYSRLCGKPFVDEYQQTMGMHTEAVLVQLGAEMVKLQMVKLPE